MKECKKCGRDYQQLHSEKICKKCMDRTMEDFMQDVKYTRQNCKKTTFKSRPGWTATCYNTVTRLEETSDFVHIDLNYRGKSIEISIKKHEEDNDCFQIWLGDTQFVVKTNDGNFKTKDNYDGHGEILKEVPFKQVDVKIDPTPDS